MSNDIKILEVEEHEDGSATLQLECNPETIAAILNLGFVTLLKAGLETDKESES